MANTSKIFAISKDEKDLAERFREEKEKTKKLQKVGQLTLETDWLKKPCTIARRRLGEQIWFKK